jgi:prolipoprotein diacylglyceryltransferase
MMLAGIAIGAIYWFRVSKTDGRLPLIYFGGLVVALVALLVMRARHWQIGQHFHLYLIAYGLFRFTHEFLRDTPKPFAGLSGYQILALATAGAALIAYRRRAISQRLAPAT